MKSVFSRNFRLRNPYLGSLCPDLYTKAFVEQLDKTCHWCMCFFFLYCTSFHSSSHLHVPFSVVSIMCSYFPLYTLYIDTHSMLYLLCIANHTKHVHDAFKTYLDHNILQGLWRNKIKH